MSRTTSVHFSPPVGCRIVLNHANGGSIVASTLSIRDKTPFKHRTPKGTPKGQEYFYVKIKMDNKWQYVKMLNSLTLPQCISEDGKFTFDGEMPNGSYLTPGVTKTMVRNKVKSVAKPITSVVQTFGNTSI